MLRLRRASSGSPVSRPLRPPAASLLDRSLLARLPPAGGWDAVHAPVALVLSLCTLVAYAWYRAIKLPTASNSAACCVSALWDPVRLPRPRGPSLCPPPPLRVPPLRAAPSDTAAVAPLRRKAVVVGGGPAGAMMAFYLAQLQGFDVSVHEALPEPLAPEGDAELPRSYNVVLNDRAVAALEEVGVSLEALVQQGLCVKLEGVCRHRFGVPAVVSPTGFRDTYSIGRSALAHVLLTRVTDLFVDRATVHWGQKLVSLDTTVNKAIFQAPGGTLQEQSYDLLIGADGVNSVVRDCLAAQHPNVFSVTQTADFKAFKTFLVPDVAALPEALPNWGRHFHVWQSADGELLCPPTASGGLTCTWVLDADKWATRVSTEQAAAQFLQATYPTAFKGNAPPGATAAQLAAKRPTRLVSTYCSRLSVGNVALVGDAGHSMWASLGQGTNCALESCRVLARCLASTMQPPDRVSEALTVAQACDKYNAERLEDARACVELSERGMGSSKSRSVRLGFVVQIVITMFLNKLFPALFPPVALFNVSRRDVRYSEVLRGSEAEKRRMWAVLGVVVLLGVAAAMWRFGAF